MDWPTVGFGSFPTYSTAPATPAAFYQTGEGEGEGDGEEDNDDFYGYDEHDYQDSTGDSSARNANKEVRLAHESEVQAD